MPLSGYEMREAVLMCTLLLARFHVMDFKPNIDDWKTRGKIFNDKACGLSLWRAIAYYRVFENVAHK